MGFSQFEITNWVHPGIKFSEQFHPGYATLYTNNNITFISNDDSTKIYDNTYGLYSNFQINSKINFTIDINHKENQFKISFLTL